MREMCKVDDRDKMKQKKRFSIGTMGLKSLGVCRVEKLKSSMVNARSPRMKLWLIRATTTVLLWTCFVQLTALGGTWGPRVLKGWPSCFTQDSHSASALDLKLLPTVPARVLPPKSEFFLLSSLLLSLFLLFFFSLFAVTAMIVRSIQHLFTCIIRNYVYPSRIFQIQYRVGLDFFNYDDERIP